MMRHRDKQNQKLPPYVYLKKGRYVRVYYNPATRKQTEMRLCAGSCSIAEVWKHYEGQGSTNDLSGLAARFEKSPTWQTLAASTQRDYVRCRARVCNRPTRGGGLLGRVPLPDWTPGVVRKYVDKRGLESVSRANHELRWLKRVFAWAYERDLCDRNPARGVSLLKQAPRQHYAEHTAYAAAIQRAQAARNGYLAPMMELAYRCRMRLCEVLDLTDADLLEAGINTRRRKGSKSNITKWTPALRAAVAQAKTRRAKLMKRRGLPEQIDAAKRYLFMSQTGGRMTETTVQSAWQRLMKNDPNRFTFHDLKRKGVSDTKGDKQKASGHRSSSMLKVYDVRPDLVAPVDD